MLLKVLGFSTVALGLLGSGFFIGRLSASDASLRTEAIQELSFTPLRIQSLNIQDNDPRELQPLPGPGQGFGLPQGSEECPLYFFEDGQFFQMQPGQGFPGQEGSPELFPLQPLPDAPGTPRPAPRSIPEQLSQYQNLSLARN